MSYKSIKEISLKLGLALMFMVPLFTANTRPIVVGFLGFSIVLNVIKDDDAWFNTKAFIINGSIYLFMVLSLIYSENLGYAIKKLETMSSLFVFPLIFSLFPSNALQRVYKNKNKYMLIYIISIFLLNISFFIYHFDHYKSSLLIHYPTVTMIAQEDYNIHPIYLSMHICIALLFSFFILKKEKEKINKIALFIVDLILFIFLIILMKKGPILGFGIISTLFVIFQKRKYLWSYYFVFFFILCITIISIPKLKSKFIELFNVEYIESENLTSTNIRFSIYNYTIETIKKSPIIGHGIGDFKDELVKTYKNSPLLYTNRFNSHNQYLSFATSLGILGLTLFILILAYNFRLAIRYKNLELILLLVFYCFVMSFENILEREDGVLYFSFFISIFGLFSNKNCMNT